MSTIENTNTISLKSIESLLHLRFKVEAYQRGYKWKTQQVTELLDDISQFTPDTGDFYCLQPLIVKKITDAEEQWELIDGQQRMTTIFLLLASLHEKKYTIDYQTRPGSAALLSNIDMVELNNCEKWEDFIAPDHTRNNIDNFHFFEAYKAISKWLGNNAGKVEVLKENLLRKTQVIWYQINEETDSRDIFMRINSGKIALTNAELIKALFLKIPGKNTDNEYMLLQKERAQEWDHMEFSLQQNDFWYFINTTTKSSQSSTRIDFLFDLMSGKASAINNQDDNLYYSFLNYQKLLSSKDFKDHTQAWGKVKMAFQQLQEWYEDDDLYHLIGYIVARKAKGVHSLLVLFNKGSRRDFRNELIGIIRERVKDYRVDDLRYPDDNEKIKDILLLFNLATLITGKAGSRFPFDRYHLKEWSLEHIHASRSRQLEDKVEAKEWLKDALSMLVKYQAENVEKIREAITDLIHKDFLFNKEKEGLAELRRQFSCLFGDADDSEENLNGLENMALLDRNTNSSLNNNIFPEKRRMIIEKDKVGEFIPLITKNVFLKYYSDNALNINKWGSSDRRDYMNAMITTLEKLLSSSGKTLVFKRASS